MTKGIGFIHCADIAERDAIPAARRTIGLCVFVESQVKTYQLKGGIANSNWFGYAADAFESASNPDVNNDETQGFGLNSTWVNTTTKRVFICLDGSTGAAKWQLITDLTASSYGSLSYVVAVDASGYYEIFDNLQDAVDSGAFYILVGGWRSKNNETFPILVTGSTSIIGNVYTSTRITNVTDNPFFGPFAQNAPVIEIAEGSLRLNDVYLFQGSPNFPAIEITAPVGVTSARLEMAYRPTNIFKGITVDAGFFPGSGPCVRGIAGAGGRFTLNFENAVFDSKHPEAISINSDGGSFMTMKNCEIEGGSGFFAQKAIKFNDPSGRVEMVGGKIGTYEELIDLVAGEAIFKNVRCLDNDQNGFHLTGNNTILDLNGVLLKQGTQTYDILVDPAVVGAAVRLGYCLLDHTKVSYPGGTIVTGHVISDAPGQEQVVSYGRDYSPGTLADWSGSDPITIKAALDRLAAILGPIP